MSNNALPVAERYVLNLRGFGTHQAMLELVRPSTRVLDVGCASGLFGEAVKRERGARVCGVEADDEAGKLASARLDAVVIGDAARPEVQAEIAGHGPFDHVVLGDVLEHMAEPLLLLRAVVRLLAPGGSVIVSLPNVVSLKARARLAAGVWRYEENGVFDRTHLRFFSVATARELLSDAGLMITTEFPVGPITHRLGRRGVRLNALRPGLLATQVVFDAAPRPQG